VTGVQTCALPILFIYAAGLYLSKSRNSELKVYRPKINLNETQHGSQIEDILNIENSISQRKSSLNNKYVRALSFLSRRSKIFRLIVEKFARKYFSDVIGYDSKLESLKIPLEICGYFQSYRYVNEIKSSFEFEVANPSDWFLNMRRMALDADFVSIHLRRGDYVSQSQTYGVLSDSYYLSALRRLSPQDQKLDIWVFTDDLETTKKELNLGEGRRIIWVSPPAGSAATESLYLMSLAKVNIIANSTFSWWAAYMSKSGSVFAPDPWYKSMNEPKDLIPPIWTRIPSAWVEKNV
jgi:hypothetical protein